MNPPRRPLMVIAERLERGVEEIDKQFEDAAAQARQDKAGVIEPLPKA